MVRTKYFYKNQTDNLIKGKTHILSKIENIIEDYSNHGLYDLEFELIPNVDGNKLSIIFPGQIMPRGICVGDILNNLAPELLVEIANDLKALHFDVTLAFQYGKTGRLSVSWR